MLEKYKNLTFRKAIETDIDTLISIYDSANSLFDESFRAGGTKNVFIDLLNDSEVFIYNDNKDLAFLSSKLVDDMLIVTGMYVLIEHQRNGLGTKMLNDLLEQTEDIQYIILRALKNAHWSNAFYKKYGFILIDELDELSIEELSPKLRESHHANTWVMKYNYSE